jgi:hypothetical protein
MGVRDPWIRWTDFESLECPIKNSTVLWLTQELAYQMQVAREEFEVGK